MSPFEKRIRELEREITLLKQEVAYAQIDARTWENKYNALILELEKIAEEA